MEFLIAYYVVINIVALFLYASDKRRAKRRKYRISESLLMGIGLLGGAIGAMIGMKTFRHKTKHWYFWIVNLFAIALHAVILFVFFSKIGFLFKFS